MNDIKMIPIEKLVHHPENPRMDLGDLTELTESIRANGILQNLTVARPAMYADGDPDIWWVVIGNRRMEAAKLAGLSEVPAVIMDMDYKTQLATMLQENMQRSDLTVYEQAKGIQMMMDLGFSKDQVSEKTGFSKTTIERRLAVASLPDQETKSAVSLGYDLIDLVEISKIEDKKVQEDLLIAPTSTGRLDQTWLRQRIANAKREDRRKNELKRLLPDIEKFAKPMKDSNDRWNGNKWEHLRSLDVQLQPEAQVKPPKDPDNYYYCVAFDTIEIWRKLKHTKQVKTDAEIALEKKQHDAKELNDRMRENRISFVNSYAPNKTQETKLKAKFADWVFGWKSKYDVGSFKGSYHSWSIGRFRLLAGIPMEEGRDPEESLQDELKRRGVPSGRAFLAWLLCGGLKEDDRPGYASQYNGVYTKDEDMDDVYEILKEAGYQLSEEEQQWKDGTHPFFRGEQE